MNNMSRARKNRHSAILLLRNLPKDATEEHLSDFLWARLGLNIPPDYLSVKPLEPPFDSANCLAVVTRETLADFLSRALEGVAFAGRQIEVHQPKPRIVTSPTEGREDERSRD